MNPVKGIHDLIGLPWVVHSDDLAGPLGGFILVKLEENLGTGTFSVCKAIQNDQLIVLGQRPELIQKVFRGTVEADVNDRPVLCLRRLNEVEAECGGQTAGIVIPDDVVSDEETSEKLVQLADSRVVLG